MFSFCFFYKNHTNNTKHPCFSFLCLRDLPLFGKENDYAQKGTVRTWTAYHLMKSLSRLTSTVPAGGWFGAPTAPPNDDCCANGLDALAGGGMPPMAPMPGRCIPGTPPIIGCIVGCCIGAMPPIIGGAAIGRAPPIIPWGEGEFANTASGSAPVECTPPTCICCRSCVG